MKLVTFDAGRVGRLEGELVVELDCASTREWFERGGQVGETGERLPLADVRLRAPIVPKKFFHTAGNFADHHKELQAVDWSHPVHKGIVFFQNVDAIVGPDDAIVYPEGLTKELDYELELAIVIGRSGKFFGPDEAADYIAGYTVFNDITARDIQRREMQSGVFSFSKAIDTFCPIGPWIVTADEVPDVHALAMELRVNGEVRQRGNTGQMLISIPHLVAYHSAQGYSAGDILTTGTISGVAAVQPNPFDFYLQPGDSIEAEIEGVGVLRNHVVPWSAAHDTPPYTTDLYSADQLMPGLHHVGYWVDDLAAAQARWEAELGVGPFQVIEHVPFDSFAFADGDHVRGDVVFDHSAAFAAWGPVVVELDQVHAIDDRLAAAYGVVPGAVSHVSWVVPDLARGERAAGGAGLRADQHRPVRPDHGRLARRRAAVPAPDRGPPAQRRHLRDARPAVRARAPTEGR